MPMLARQFAEFLGLVEAGGRNRSGDAVVERYHQVAGWQVDACILLIIGAKLGRRNGSK